jgi:predicted N-formylglutamate amidohydrolase
MPEFDFVFLSCEHAGNIVPPKYMILFAGYEDVLETHRGYDPGALEIAQLVSGKLNAPLIYQVTSRLLIEINRSRDSKDLYSEFSGKLSNEEKAEVMAAYYNPFRVEQDGIIRSQVEKGKHVLHVSIHTCTDELNGQKRYMDYAILFDEEREKEKLFAESLRKAINERFRDLVVAFNFPYQGVSDGTVETLRRKYPENLYTGIEIEINQKYFLGPNKNPEKWDYVKNALVKGLYKVVKQKTE